MCLPELQKYVVICVSWTVHSESRKWTVWFSIASSSSTVAGVVSNHFQALIFQINLKFWNKEMCAHQNQSSSQTAWVMRLFAALQTFYILQPLASPDWTKCYSPMLYRNQYVQNYHFNFDSGPYLAGRGGQGGSCPPLPEIWQSEYLYS